MKEIICVALLGVLVYVTGMFSGYHIGTNNPNLETIQGIELSVYEKEMGKDLGSLKYKCLQKGGSLVVQGRQGVCIINGGDL